MNIQNNSNITFCQLMPTKALLKTAAGINNFEEAKSLNQSIGVKYAGHIGFHKRAANIVQNIVEKDKNFQQMVNQIMNLPVEQRLTEINKIVSTVGENIDVII